MNDEIIVAVFDTEAHADAAVRDLEAARVPPEAISLHGGTDAASGSPGDSANPRGQGFWSSLFGGEPDHDTAVYDRSLESGSSVVTVRVADEQQVERIMALLERHQPIDLEERAASFGLAANRTSTAAVGTPLSDRDTLRDGAKEVLPLSEEQLTVGKRLINRGTTRIRRFVVETPVEENVTLHAERVSIDRRPAAATTVGEADFTDRTIKVTETDEEAVVGKAARVREEVIVHKEATDRVETVRDTVRRQDVEIERSDATSPRSGTVPTPKI
jgi:uncharacterized protein (TIGR02271 family)